MKGAQTTYMRSVPLLILALLTSALGCAAETAGDDVATDDLVETHDAADDFYVIAHMTNTPEAARWAIGQGANAVEIDLRFDDDGTPTSFKHGGICDCLCAMGDDHVCSVLEPSCNATSGVPQMFEALHAIPELALVMIDSKIDGDASAETQRAAGTRVIDALTTGLFARGYRGKVVVAAPKTDARVYIEAAARAAARSVFAKRISFAFDQMGKSAANAACTLDTLSELTPNRVFGTGVSACAIGNYEPAVRAAAESERAGTSGLTYVWTLDRAESMRRYIDAGARGIITNKPSKLVEVVQASGKKLAKPSTTFTSSSAARRPTCG